MPISKTPVATKQPIRTVAQRTASAIKSAVALGIATAIVPQQSQMSNYIIGAIVGGAFGYYEFNNALGLDEKYPVKDKYGELKGKIEGALVGVLLVSGIIALKDETISTNHKLIIASGMGAVLGYEITDSEIIVQAHGGSMIGKDIIGSLIGAVSGGGLYYLLTKK
jgi:hypothetical protein